MTVINDFSVPKFGSCVVQSKHLLLSYSTSDIVFAFCDKALFDLNDNSVSTKLTRGKRATAVRA